MSRGFALVACALCCAMPSLAQQDAAARRALLLTLKPGQLAAVERLSASLNDTDPVVARTAARLLGQFGHAALPSLRKALRSDDVLVRRNAVASLGAIGRPAVPDLLQAIEDPHVLIRQATVFALSRVRPMSDEVSQAIAAATSDEQQAVRDAALDVLRTRFVTTRTIPLPEEGWKFKTDPDNQGEQAGWFAADFDDSGWLEIGIGKSWEEFGQTYDGVAWYRRTVELPAIDPPPARAVLAFGGVDEDCWVWINGKSAGAHATGPMGWDKPFRLDVTHALQWGQANQITVKVNDSAFAGGIWRPVELLVLEEAQ